MMKNFKRLLTAILSVNLVFTNVIPANAELLSEEFSAEEVMAEREAEIIQAQGELFSEEAEYEAAEAVEGDAWDEASGSDTEGSTVEISDDSVTTLAAATSLNDVVFQVNKNEEAGLGGNVTVSFQKTGSNYKGTLYLPGSAETDKLTFAWGEGITVKENDISYESGQAPVPARGESKTFKITGGGGNSADFTVTTMQGSEGVEGMFLEIDEDLGTIAAMNGDRNHETSCYGVVNFEEKKYDMSMKGRGNWTWGVTGTSSNPSKKPYNITIYKDENPDKDIERFDKKNSVSFIKGIKAKKWSILANYADGSLLRNKIGYDLACELGIGLESKYIDVWLNGQYHGNYLLTPKNDYNAPDGGYALELDNNIDAEDPYFSLDGLLPAKSSENVITVKNVGDDAVDAGVTTDDIHEWMQTMLDAVVDTRSDDYLKYVDIDSWAKLYLLQEFYKNHDIICGSILMHRDGLTDKDKLIAGPVWDLDNALGRVFVNDHNGISTQMQRSANGWYIDSINGYTSFLQYLGMHEDFMQRVYEIYNEYRKSFDGVTDNLDSQAALISDSTNMNYSVWNINQSEYNATKVSSTSTLGTGSYAYTEKKTQTYQDYLDNLRSYVVNRLAFLSDNLAVTVPEGSITGNTILAVDDTLTLTTDCSANTYQWQSSSDGENWTNITGATAKTYSVKATAAMNNLQIRLVVKNTKSVINTSRVAKVAPAATATLGPVTLTVSKNGFFVAKNTEAGLDGDVNITFTKSNNNYSGTLYLPGGVDTSKLTLSWGSNATVSMGEITYASGEAPIPDSGANMTYSVTLGGRAFNYTLKTMQGSAGVSGMFLEIDESLGSIATMIDDEDHEETCYGNISLDGKTYDMSIKGRGNSSWTFAFDKKPYNITLYKNEDADKGVEKYSEKKKAEWIKGVEAKKWTILANAKDSSLLRNKIGYDIALAMGLGVDNRFIDVWMNGEYLGNYLLTPKTDTIAPKNGYQIELERRTDNEDPQFTLKGFENGTRPIYFTVKDNGAEAETSEIKAYMQKVADAILDKNSSDYLNYIDLDSWAKMYLLNELYKDVDVVTDSIFMYRNGTNDDDKLYAGPIWDLDGAIGRTYSNGYCGVDDTNQISPDKWYIDGIQYDNNRGYLSWFQMLGRHQEFMQRVYELYNEYSEEFDALETQIAAQASVITDSAAMNFNIHPVNQTVEKMFNVENTKSVGSGAYKITYKVTNSWSDYVDNLKMFVSTRNAFFSDNLTVALPVGTITGATTVAVGDGLTLTADCAADSYQWQSSTDGEVWTNIDGATGKIYSVPALYSMNGLHIRCVAKNMGNLINTTRVAKVAPAASVILAPVTLTVTLEGHEHSYADVVTTPTCTEKGYTTYTCPCGDSYVDNYTDPLGHNYVDGKCTRCGKKDPEFVPECVAEKSVSLANGTFLFTLGGNRIGEFTFAKSGNGWTIEDEDGKFLAFANNAFTYSDSAFVWTYSNNAFTTSVASSGSSTPWSGYGGYGGYGGGNWGNTTTTYYLTYSGGRFTASTSSNGSNAGFIKVIENLKHSFGNWTAKNGVHSRTCSVCGKVETGNCEFREWTTVNGIHSHTCSICLIEDSDKCSFTKWTTKNEVHSRTCTVCHAEETGGCSYGDWMPDENDQHSKICSVCGEKISQACGYGTDHKCTGCGRIDPEYKKPVAAVVEKINAIGTVAYTTAIKGKIDAARSAYNALTEDQKKLITTAQLKVLTDAETSYGKLKTDQDAASAVVEKINAIGTVAYTTAIKGKINAARSAYNALTADQKELITAAQLKVLTDAEEAYAKLGSDQDAATVVVDKINAIGTVAYTTTSKTLIDAARSAYNALTADQKKLVTSAQLKVLTDAEEAYTKLKADHDAATVSAVVEKINAIGTVAYTTAIKGKIDAARSAYNALTADQKNLVTSAQLKVLTDAEAAYEKLKTDQGAATAVIDKINAIGTVEYTTAIKGKIDAARSAYNALTADQKNLVTSAQLKKLTDAEEAYAKLGSDQDAATVVVDKINSIGTVAYTTAIKGKIDAARSAYNALTADQKKLVTSAQLKVLTDAEEAYAKLGSDQDAATVVVDKINAIGTVAYTEASKALIDVARSAYNELTAEQKKLVTSAQLKVLTDAEDAYTKLGSDHDAATAVVEKINAIGTVAYTTESKAKIDAARAAYNALTADQRKLVTAAQLKVLTDAEEKYDFYDTEKYTVTWMNWNGSILETDEDVAYGTTPTYNGATPTKPADAWYSYTFAGWDKAITAVTGDATYTAVFSQMVRQYKVTFDVNGNGSSPETITVSVGQKITKPADPSASSYTFGGWYKEASCTNEWRFDTELMPGKDITLYAKWTYSGGKTGVDGGGSSSGGSGGGGGSSSGGSGGGSAGGPGAKSTTVTGAPTFSKNWVADAAGAWRIRDKAGNYVTSAWLCDDAVTSNGQNVWYLMNTDGTMLAAGLVQDNTGNYYSLEMNHNGYYGMLRYTNGTYDGIYMEFSQKHDGTFGAITNQSAIDALKAKYGVTRFGIGNDRCVYTKSFE